MIAWPHGRGPALVPLARTLLPIANLKHDNILHNLVSPFLAD